MEFTPKQIVGELDRYIIGQDEAKKAVAIALRNRYRRSRLSEELREEITPKNIIMKGPTGVGKTEIARRLARLVKAPFVKVEATKFTEVGYVGRDVESIVRDLVEASIRLVREEKFKEVQPKVTDIVEKKLVNIILPIRKQAGSDEPDASLKEEILQELRKGNLDKLQVSVEAVDEPKNMQIDVGQGQEINIGSIFGNFMPKKKKMRTVTVKQARDIFVAEESAKLVDSDSIASEALRRAEQDGVIFIDEIDKVAARGNTQGPDVSREGVQRDILPIVEGCAVQTKYGVIRTDFILFIAAGAFHISKVQDLIPELQGRFPIKVELNNLTENDFVLILTQPDNAILKQYKELLKVDGVELEFTDDAIREIARIATMENENSENLGARRLHAVMEALLEELSYNAGGSEEKVKVTVDKDYVDEHLSGSLKTMNLRRYII
ncbi:MAG: ATP-dependent protease ATPase subunit HslU [Eubacteriales bacterium]|nr:ATP-dependent protease ATPase subunit HslU [Christensenellaceae bacterium]MDY2750724.1 ATP-dependent protease ATPase subunit HslU [Eubacteriales bacterium]MDY4709158.1 ATP-dependent protease ATPase subunit HslU [Eubacteriales bacterium]